MKDTSQHNRTGFKGDPQRWQALMRRAQAAKPQLAPAISTASGGSAELVTPSAYDAEYAEYEETPYLPRKRRPLRESVPDWFRARTPDQWAFAILLVVGAVLRLWGLADKPLHHDESLHAYFSLQFAENPSSYLYDPLLHGPFQFHVIPIFFALGRLLGLPDGGVNDFTVRLLPAIMGMAMVIMPYWLRPYLGRWGALAMGFLLAVSPTFVYQSRYVRDDIYVTCCTLLIVVAALQYYQTRKLGWLVIGTAALMVSYAAMENTYFTIAAFGSFLVALLLWDLGPALGAKLRGQFAERDQPLAGRILLLTPFVIVMGVAGLLGLHWLGQLSNTINDLAAKYPQNSPSPLNPENTIKIYEGLAVAVLLIGSIIISTAVIIGLLLQTRRDAEDPFGESAPPRAWVNPRNQPVLDTLLSTHWIRWFVCFVVAWLLFAIFFWKLPSDPLNLTEWGTGFNQGLGRGLLHGLYYWLEQQHVARGGQPWYYYFILIPMYEQLALVFGLAGVVRALLQPTRFRLFLVYWFGVNVVLYSWAGEKMPWLVIHIMLPLMALAGLSLDWVIRALVRGASEWWTPTKALIAFGLVAIVAGIASQSAPTAMWFAIALSLAAVVAVGAITVMEQWSRRRSRRIAERHDLDHLAPAPRWTVGAQQIVAAGSLVVALALLVPMLWNMQRLNFYEPSVAPNEMMIYVQTTTDVQLAMAKINHLDQVLDHGQHKLRIGVTPGAVWPYAWYLRDYPAVFDPKTNTWTAGALFNYSPTTGGVQPDVILGDLDGDSQSVNSVYPNQYASHQYRLRWWWDESYKLPQCSKTKTSQCDNQATWSSGDGPFLWISYGAYPPAPQNCADFTNPKCDPLNDKPNAADAAQRYWNWLWLRQNISGTPPGSTDFVLYIRADLTKIEQP